MRMLRRKPVVAGKFYAGNPDQLQNEVRDYLAAGEAISKPAQSDSVWAVMLPHAGHIFCGKIIGATLAGLNLSQKLIIFCPNHTGYGVPIGVWPEGEWITPLGSVTIDSKIAGELLATNSGYQPDLASHLGEHSIEVLLPFLQEKVQNPEIIPVSVGTRNPHLLRRAGAGLAQVLKHNSGVGVIISSDMNHYESHKTTIAKDELALDRVLAGDGDGLLETVDKNNISMCGAGPMAIALYAARDLGLAGAELVCHDTSGPVSGDMEHTVGYAGVRLFW